VIVLDAGGQDPVKQPREGWRQSRAEQPRVVASHAALILGQATAEEAMQGQVGSQVLVGEGKIYAKRGERGNGPQSR
jgi:hypothetical protein